MVRSLLLAVSLLTLAFAGPTLAQERRPESAREAGLRYLTWPGRPAVQSAPVRPRQTPPAPRPERTPQPAPQPAPDPEPQRATPAVVAESPVQARVEQLATPRPEDEGVRYYSVHRGAGRTPDPLPQAQVLAADQTLVALQSPQGQSLAEQDRTARAEEAFEILRSLPPDQLMDMLGRTQ